MSHTDCRPSCNRAGDSDEARGPVVCFVPWRDLERPHPLRGDLPGQVPLQQEDPSRPEISEENTAARGREVRVVQRRFCRGVRQESPLLSVRLRYKIPYSAPLWSPETEALAVP